MPAKQFRYIVYSQGCFYLGLLICTILKPKGLTINQGISYYGVFWLTIVPYCFGLLGGAYFCWRYALQLKKPDLWLVRYTFVAMSLLIIGVALTPDTLGRFIDDLHVTCGSILFVLQLLFSGWLIVQLQYDFRAIALSLLELMAGVMSFIYLAPKHGYLLESQVVFQLSFGILILYSLPQLFTRNLTDSGS